MSFKLTTDGMGRIKKPYVVWDEITIDIVANRAVFKHKGVPVGYIQTSSLSSGVDTVTVTGMKGKVEVTMS